MSNLIPTIVVNIGLQNIQPLMSVWSDSVAVLVCPRKDRDNLICVTVRHCPLCPTLTGTRWVATWYCPLGGKVTCPLPSSAAEHNSIRLQTAKGASGWTIILTTGRSHEFKYFASMFLPLKNWFCLLVNEESCQVKNSYPRPSDLCIKLAMRLSIKKNNSIKQSLYFLWVYWQNDDMGSFLLKY